MPAWSTALRPPAFAALVVAAGSAATLLGAAFFQYVLNIPPCPLCLEQRIPHYIAVPLALVVMIAAMRKAPRWALALGFAALALAMLTTAGVGVYHSGVEWKWWEGPRDCSGPISGFGNTGDLLRQLESISIVRCDEVLWRGFGLSLAGYNALISLALAAFALWGLRLATKRG
jgi:disulfide bond formation protein DsbB